MINKENIPKGKDFEQLHVNNYGGYVQIETSKYYGQGLDLLDCEHVGIKQAEANGELFVEAFNVYSKTGMTPKDLHRELNTKVKNTITKHKINISLQREIEQLQQERDEAVNLLSELVRITKGYKVKSLIDVTIEKCENKIYSRCIRFLESLTTQQEQFKPCGEGENTCNCKTEKECGYTQQEQNK